MGRKAGRESSREQVEVEELPGEIEPSDQAVETFERIQFLKEKFGDDATGRASIQRRLKDGRLIGLPSIPALTFDTDLVAKRYGGGRYYVRFYQGRQYLGDIEFELDESLRPETPEETKAAATATAPVDGAPPWLAVTLGQMTDAIRALAETRKQEPVTPVDPMAMIRAIGETMKALTPAPPPALPPGPGLKDQIDMIKSVVEVGTSILDARGDSGGGSSGDDYMNTVSKLAEPITDLVRLRVQQETDRRRLNPAARQPRLTQPRNAVTGAAPVPAQPGGQPVGLVPAWLVEVQKWVPMIAKRARNGKSAEDTAFFVLDELSEPTVQALAQVAAQPDFDVKLAQVLPPELRQYPEWNAEFVAAIRDWLFGGDEGAAGGDDESPEDEGPVGLGSDEDEIVKEVVEEEVEVFDLDAEAKRRLAAMKDKEEPAPTA